MTKKQKKFLYRIVVSFLVFLLTVLFLKNEILIIGYLAAYLIIGYDVIIKAVKNIFHGQVFDECFLMVLATIGAFVTSEYPEGVMVMWLYQVGELFQSYAVGKSRESITALMEIAPEYANLLKDGQLVKVDPDELEIGDEFVVKVGEKVAVDGVVVKGETSLNTSALTGESRPFNVFEGDEVLSGSINLTSPVTLKATKLYDDSTVAKILDLVENASSKKAKTENFITKFAKYYTPAVVLMAVLLAIIPPLFNGEWMEYLRRACSFLVISCPCALVISVPLSFFSGIGASSRSGILVKGSNYLEALSKTNTIAFDKTGTLTYGQFKLTEVKAINTSEEELLNVALIAEDRSNHPIALSLKKMVDKQIDTSDVVYQEIAGKGIVAKIGNDVIYAGNHQLMDDNRITFSAIDEASTIVHIAKNKQYLGYLRYGDEVKKEAKELIASLKAEKIKTVMLSGDQNKYAKTIGNQLGIDEVYAELLPQDKLDKLESLMNNDGNVAYVGDGINDAPSLTRADIGIAMGGLGSDAAIEVSDIVIVDDNLSKISKAIKISRKTMRIVWQNIIFALSVKFGIMILGAIGIASMWMAVFADVGVSFIAIINAMRALRTK